MRMTRSSGLTKILPSPILPVFATLMIDSIIESTISSRHAISILIFGKNQPHIPPHDTSRYGLLATKAFDFSDGDTIDANF